MCLEESSEHDGFVVVSLPITCIFRGLSKLSFIYPFASIFTECSMQVSKLSVELVGEGE